MCVCVWVCVCGVCVCVCLSVCVGVCVWVDLCVCVRVWWSLPTVTGDLDSILVKDSHDICTVCGSYSVSVNYSYEQKIVKVEGSPCNVTCKRVIAW